MDEKEIRERNRLIALFEGYREIPGWDGYEFGYTLHPTIDVACIGDIQLDYHLSWNSLMPVVEKIENELGKLLRIEGYICDATSAANDNPRLPPFRIIRDTNKKIDSVWQVVVEIIKWYNSAQ